MSIPTHARICPFCRQSFQLSGVRRLHLAPVEETDKDREAALLERFLLAVDSEDPSELESIVAEVDAWFEQGKESLVLEKARNLLTRHQQLKAQRKQHRKEVKALEQTVQQLEEIRMGGSTIGEVRELRRRAKQDRILIESLQEQLYGPRPNNKGKAKESWNPLPTPPDILPFDELTGTYNDGAGGSRNPIPTPSDMLPFDDPARINKGKAKELYSLPTYPNILPFDDRAHNGKGKGKAKELWNPLPPPPDMTPFDGIAQMLRDALEHDTAAMARRHEDGQSADHLILRW